MSLEAVLQRLEAVAAKLESASARVGGGGGDGDARIVQDYDAYYASFIAPFVATCGQLDGLKPIGKDAETAFKFLRTVFDVTTKAKKPSDSELMAFVKPIVDVVSKAQNADNRSPVFNHQKAWGEASQLFNFLFIGAPAQHVSSMLEAADFYLTKILTIAKDAKDDEKKIHRDFVAQMKALITNLADLLKDNCKGGLNWNLKGVSLKEAQAGASSSSSAAPAASAPEPPGGAPPPPPPPVDPNFVLNVSGPPAEDTNKPAAAGLGAVFAQINAGNVTAGLKHVTKDMKTKNMKDAPVLEAKSAPAAVAPKAVVAEAKKPAATELRQGTWFVENYENTENTVNDVQMKQSVYIYKCNNATIVIPDKVKSVQIDNCTKTRVSIAAVVSTFEIVNSKRCTLYVNELCPSLTVDKCSGVQIVLNDVAYKQPPQFVTSCATEVNVMFPGATPEADPIELPIAEQFLTTLKDGKLITETVKHSGA